MCISSFGGLGDEEQSSAANWEKLRADISKAWEMVWLKKKLGGRDNGGDSHVDSKAGWKETAIE